MKQTTGLLYYGPLEKRNHLKHQEDECNIFNEEGGVEFAFYF